MCRIQERWVPVSSINIASGNYKYVNYLKTKQVLNMVLVVDGAVTIYHLLGMLLSSIQASGDFWTGDFLDDNFYFVYYAVRWAASPGAISTSIKVHP